MAENAPATVSPTHNIQHLFAYEDLRRWLDEAERFGELEVVTGAS